MKHDYLNDYLNLDDGKIFYSISGKGDPIILLHGNFNDHQIWNEQAETFSAYYETIRYDLRGYGLSSTPDSSFSNVHDLKALIDFLKLPSVTLLGSSSGGAVAIDFALTYPGLVRSLILVSPSVTGNSYPLPFMWHGLINYMNVTLRGREKAVEAFITSPFWRYYFPPLSNEEARNKVLRNVRNTDNFCRVPPKLSIAAKPYAISRLEEINIPTLIFISDQDHPFNLKTAEILNTTIKHSSKIMMHGCGHLPFIEKPDEFNERVLAFLSS
ncbi:AB hydrolase superfamily protein YdjP [compost metagenome]